MTKKTDPKCKTTNETPKNNELELEEMLQEARKKADKEAEADFSPLLNKIKSLESQLQEKEEIAKNSQIAYLHLKSDFDLLQRQTEQKMQNAERDIIITVTKKLIPFVENLRKSLLNLSDEQKKSWIGEGLQMVYENFLKSLENFKIYPIKAIGLDPDPQFHEPVNMQATEDKKLKWKIIQEFEQWFIYKGWDNSIVITPSKVVIGN